MDETFSCTDFLAHHGILGQRWGVRRYQNPDGSLTAEGKKRYGGSSKIQKTIKKKLDQRKKEKEAKKEANKLSPEEEKEKLKDYLRDHPKKLPKYRKVITQEDAEEVINNIKFDRKLKDIRKEEIDRGFGQIKAISSNIKTVNDLFSSTKDAWNNTADVLNTMSDAGIISGGFHMQKLGVSSDMDVRSQSLYSLSPEEVLKNKSRYTNAELENYKKRKTTEENIDKFTTSGRQRQKQNEDFDKAWKNDEFEKAKEIDPDKYEEKVKAANAVK